MYEHSATKMWNETSTNLTECGWPPRNYRYIWQSTGFKYTELILHPIWLLICTVGNVLNILLLRKIRTFQAVLVTAIAYFDILTMWGWFVLSLQVHIGSATTRDEPTRSFFDISAKSVKAFLVTCEFLGNIGSHCSDWLLVAFSITRLLLVIGPLHWRVRLTSRLMRKVILCALPPAVAASLFPVLQYATGNNPAITTSWIAAWQDVHYIGQALESFVLFLIILLTNSFVAVLLLKRRQLIASTICKNQSSCRKYIVKVNQDRGTINVELRASDRTEATTNTLLTASVIMFLVTTVPYMTWYLLLEIEKHCLLHLSDDQYAILVSFFLQLLYANYSLNFVVYCGASRSFLKWFLQLISRSRLCTGERAEPDNPAHLKSSETESSVSGTSTSTATRHGAIESIM